MPATRYNIYRSKTAPVNIDNIDNLVASNVKENTFVWNDLPEDSHWAVTAVNAYEIESVPATWHEKRPRSKMHRDRFTLPDAQTWGMRVLIKDFTGKMIHSSPYNESVNVEGLAPGCYRLEVMSRKGETLERHTFVR
jgi:hypothetical protein